MTKYVIRRIIQAIPRSEVDREIKRGPGGLRDIEFAVQLLQLVHGRGDERLRLPGTLEALRALIAGGYVGLADGEELLRGYRFLRVDLERGIGPTAVVVLDASGKETDHPTDHSNRADRITGRPPNGCKEKSEQESTG